MAGTESSYAEGGGSYDFILFKMAVFDDANIYYEWVRINGRNRNDIVDDRVTLALSPNQNRVYTSNYGVSTANPSGENALYLYSSDGALEKTFIIGNNENDSIYDLQVSADN